MWFIYVTGVGKYFNRIEDVNRNNKIQKLYNKLGWTGQRLVTALQYIEELIKGLTKFNLL